MTDPCYLSATETLELFRTRELSPVELLDSQISRASEMEPTVNALAYTHFDQAMDAARKAERRYGRTDGRPRKLEGLTLVVKEDTAIRGFLQTYGSMIHRRNIADHTNPSVERLIRAGAIVHAQATCPEFVWPWTCTSKLHGVTRNPWNPDVTCGASSGGSAAAVASGTTSLATGSDSAGSIRMPAAMCGIVGYKPPYGRNPASPDVALDPFFTVGPMTRTTDDAALMQNIMSGYHRHDQASLTQRTRIPLGLQDVSGMKIAWSYDLDIYAVSEVVRRNMDTVMALLESLGVELEWIPTHWAAAVKSSYGAWGGLIYADEFRDAVTQAPDQVSVYTKTFADENDAYTPRMLHECMKIIGAAWRDFGSVLSKFDAFICPTVGTNEIPAEWPDWVDPLPVGGKSFDIHDIVMTPIFNAFGRCPALAVPSGFATNGVPTGIQIVGNPCDDKAVFRVAQTLGTLIPRFDTITAETKSEAF